MKTLLHSLILISPLPAMGAVSYFEDFGAERADGVYPMSDEGWSGFFSNPGTSGNASTLIQNSGGTRGGLAEGTSWSGNTSAYLFVQNTTTGVRSDFFAFTTTGISFVPPSATIVSWNTNRTSFAFSSVDPDVSSTYSFAVQIDSGSWYAVTTNYSSTTNVSFTLDSASFNAITFGGDGAPMSIDTGSSSTFASLFGSGQSVTGIGFYGSIAAGASPSTTRTLRIDNLSIIPEPSAALFGMISLAGLVGRRKR